LVIRRSRYGSWQFCSISTVNWILLSIELRNWWKLLIWSSGITVITSSKYRFHNGNTTGVYANILSSRFYIVNSARTTEIGDPIGVPWHCLYNCPRHSKVAASKQNLVRVTISSLFKVVTYYMTCALFSSESVTHCRAKSRGIEVNKDFTSKETRELAGGITRFSRASLAATVFLSFYWAKFVNGVRMLDRCFERL